MNSNSKDTMASKLFLHNNLNLPNLTTMKSNEKKKGTVQFNYTCFLTTATECQVVNKITYSKDIYGAIIYM